MTHLSSIPEYRTIWISDLHLGTRGCKAEFLLDFLKYTEAETIYLVGDIIDGWRLRKSWYWPQAHNDVIQKVLRKVRKGTRVVYVPGNHDEWLRDFTQLQFGGVEVVEDAIHVTADGRRLLVIHGDAFDAVVITPVGWPCSVTAPTPLLSGSTGTSTPHGAGSDISTGRYRPISSGGSRTPCNTSARLPTLLPTKLAAAGLKALSAATSTMPSCARSAAFSIATAATGSRAAPLSSSISTAGLN